MNRVQWISGNLGATYFIKILTNARTVDPTKPIHSSGLHTIYNSTGNFQVHIHQISDCSVSMNETIGGRCMKWVISVIAACIRKCFLLQFNIDPFIFLYCLRNPEKTDNNRLILLSSMSRDFKALFEFVKRIPLLFLL